MSKSSVDNRSSTNTTSGGGEGSDTNTLTQRIIDAIESNHFILPDTFFSLQKVEERKASTPVLYANALTVYAVGLAIFIALFISQSREEYTETKVTTTDISSTDNSWSCSMASTVTSNYFNYKNLSEVTTSSVTVYQTPVPTPPIPNSIAQNYFLVNLNELQSQCIQDMNFADPCNSQGAVQYYESASGYQFPTTIQSFLPALSKESETMTLLPLVNTATAGAVPSFYSYDAYTGVFALNGVYNSYVLNAMTAAAATFSTATPSSLLPQLATTKQGVSLFLSPTSTVPGNSAVGCVYYTLSLNNDIVGCYPGVTKMHNDAHFNVYLSNATTVLKLNVSTTFSNTGIITMTQTTTTLVADFSTLFAGNGEQMVDFSATLTGSTTTVYAATNNGIVRSVSSSSGSSNTAAIYSFPGITGILGFNTTNSNLLLFYNGTLSTTVSTDNWLFTLDVSGSTGTPVSQQSLPDSQCPYFLAPPPTTSTSSSMVSNAIFLCASSSNGIQWFFYYPDNGPLFEPVNVYVGDALFGTPALNAGWLVCGETNIDSFYPKITQPQQMTYYCRRNGIAWEIAPENDQMFLTSTYATFYLNQLTETYCNASILYTEICDIVANLPPYICTRSKPLPFFTAVSAALANTDFAIAMMFVVVGFILSVVKNRKEVQERKTRESAAISMTTITPRATEIDDKSHKMADLEEDN